MSKKVETKTVKEKKVKKSNTVEENGNGFSSISGLGCVHCANCESIVGYFPPDVNLDDDSDLELYCFVCAEGLSKGEQ